jgi:MoaA/NifB/PqqE/SkfB family radical SAM enzyme
MENLSDLRTVHLEASSKCNARCPMCSRYTAEGFVQPGLNEVNLEPDVFYKFFTVDIAKQLEYVYISGVYGDPCMNPHLIEYSQYLINHGVNVTIDSNSGFRNSKWWEALALTGVTVNFTVDGFKDTNSIYRRNVKWEVVEANMRAFSNAGGKGIWNFIAFEHNEHDISAAEELANELNFDFNIKVTQKFRNLKEWKVVEDGTYLYTIRPPKNSAIRHPNIGSDEHIITRAPSKFDFKQAYESTKLATISCQTKKRNELYLTSNGLVLPCCWLATYEHDSFMFVKQFRDQHDLNKFDLHHHTLLEAFNAQAEIYSTFDKSFENGRLLMCNAICDTKASEIVFYLDKETNTLIDFPKE